MKKNNFGLLLLIFSVLIFQSCAKRGSPDGGPEDMEPPQYVRASPENYTTNFKADEIKIYFDEFIKLDGAQRQIIISPPMDPAPEITPLGTASKSINIHINDTLQPNTTYVINFGRSVVDNNANNPLEFFKYVFSTGSYIDSLSISGTLADAYLKEADPFISVMLYEVDSTYSDSIIYKKQPRYITNTLDSATTFQLSNLKAGKYRLVAMKDVNNNYLFEPQRDKIAFLEEFIQVPADSVFHLNLFQENLEFQSSPRPDQVAQQHLIFGFSGILESDSLKIQLLPPVPENFESRITKDRKTDTLHYFYKPKVERDSLKFEVKTPVSIDTLLVRLREAEPDSLQFTFEPSGTINFHQEVKILPNIPIENISESLITLFDKDTVAVEFSTVYDDFKNEIILNFEKQEEQKYRFTALPGAFTDFFGSKNDTLTTNFSTKAYSEFGNVRVNLQNVETFPIIVQLTTEKGEIEAEKFSTGESSFSFTYLPPGKYLIRVIYDRNGNKIWDTGNYLLKQQPEKVVYFPDVIDVHANWDIDQLFILE